MVLVDVEVTVAQFQSHSVLLVSGQLIYCRRPIQVSWCAAACLHLRFVSFMRLCGHAVHQFSPCVSSCSPNPHSGLRRPESRHSAAQNSPRQSNFFFSRGKSSGSFLWGVPQGAGLHRPRAVFSARVLARAASLYGRPGRKMRFRPRYAGLIPRSMRVSERRPLHPRAPNGSPGWPK